MPVKKAGKSITVVEGGMQTRKELAVDACYAITKKTGEPIIVAPVVTTNKRGVEVVRFRKVANPTECTTIHTLNRKVPKLKIGYKEMPKVMGIITGYRKAAPAKVVAKLTTAISKKKKTARK